MSLTPKIKQQLKGAAHKLKPVVMVGNKGVTATVNNEVDQALSHHELIKVKIQAQDRDERHQLLAEICKINHAELVQVIGSIGVLYRKNQE